MDPVGIFSFLFVNPDDIFSSLPMDPQLVSFLPCLWIRLIYFLPCLYGSDRIYVIWDIFKNTFLLNLPSVLVARIFGAAGCPRLRGRQHLLPGRIEVRA